MWGEESGDVIVEEREAGCAEPERVRGQVELPRGDGRLELSDAIAAVAETRQQGSKIDEEIDVDGGIGSQVLAQGKPPGEVPKGTALEQRERLLLMIERIGPRRKAIDGVDNQIEIRERSPSRIQAICRNAAGRAVEHRR